MTEEIIIDGVNVSECYADNKIMKDGLYCFWEGGKCEDNEYCYYKECKRLEQENKELGRKAFLAEQNVRTTASTFCEKDNKINELEQENKQMKSALEEIKEVASFHTTGADNEDVQNDMQVIIDKINEVLND